MKQLEKKNLYIRISEFGDKHFQGFSYSELKTELGLSDWEDRVVVGYMINALESGYKTDYIGPLISMQHQTQVVVSPNMDSMFFAIEKKDKINKGGEWVFDLMNDHKFILKYDAYFNYIDYLEFQEARKLSRNAMRTAIAAIVISAILASASILIQLFGTVTLDNAQFNKIINYIENKNNPK